MNVLHEIAEIIGVGPAVKLGQEMGGARLYIPAEITDTHPLALLIGLNAAQKLCEVYRGDVINIPSKSIFRMIRDEVMRKEYHTMKLEHGSRADALALKYGLSRRRVLEITKRR